MLELMDPEELGSFEGGCVINSCLTGVVGNDLNPSRLDWSE